MGILDIFKKKEEKKEKEKEVKKPLKVKHVEKTKTSTVKKPASVPPSKTRAGKKKVFQTTFRILKEPHITEKTTHLTEFNQYTFKIWPKANKIEVKKAIENLYGVDVVSVRIIKIPSKKRRTGRITGWKKGYKKAIIKIKKGQKIEVLPR